MEEKILCQQFVISFYKIFLRLSFNSDGLRSIFKYFFLNFNLTKGGSLMGSTKNKSYDQDFYRGLTKNLVLVSNEVKLISPIKTDAKESLAVDKKEQKNLTIKKKNVSVRRYVFDKDNKHYARCVQIKKEWEKWFKDDTIPYFGKGLGLVTTANYQEFARINSEFARKYEQALKKFYANYSSILEGSSVFGEGSVRARELASTLDQVKAKCGATHSVAGLGDYVQQGGAKGASAFSLVAQETNKVVSGAVKKICEETFSGVANVFSRLARGTGETKGGSLTTRSEGIKKNLNGNSTAIYSQRFDDVRNELDRLEKNNITKSPVVKQIVADGRSLLADLTIVNKKKDTLDCTDNVTVLDTSIKKIDKLVDTVNQEKIQKLNELDKAFG